MKEVKKSPAKKAAPKAAAAPKAEPKVVAAPKVEAKPVVKKAVVKAAPKAAAPKVAAAPAKVAPTPEERYRMIEEAAYYVAERHGFSGGPGSHGASVSHRHPGSIGCSSFPGHVIKGRRMAGHMGSERVTTKNLTVFAVDEENNLILIKGSVPGVKGSIVIINK